MKRLGNVTKGLFISFSVASMVALISNAGGSEGKPGFRPSTEAESHARVAEYINGLTVQASWQTVPMYEKK